MIREGRFDKEFLGSCDAIALYPSVIIEEGLELLEEKVKKDKAFAKTQHRPAWPKYNINNPILNVKMDFLLRVREHIYGGPLSKLLADLMMK